LVPIPNGRGRHRAAPGGGGLANYGGTTTLTNCTVSANSCGSDGGGLYNSAGTATLANCTVSGNSGGFVGGGLANYAGTATLSIGRCPALY
jgi:hypothetical protein